MAAGIFNPENDFWRLIEKLVDLFLLSVFWLVCSLPVFTLGPRPPPPLPHSGALYPRQRAQELEPVFSYLPGNSRLAP